MTKSVPIIQAVGGSKPDMPAKNVTGFYFDAIQTSRDQLDKLSGNNEVTVLYNSTNAPSEAAWKALQSYAKQTYPKLKVTLVTFKIWGSSNQATLMAALGGGQSLADLFAIRCMNVGYLYLHRSLTNRLRRNFTNRCSASFPALAASAIVWKSSGDCPTGTDFPGRLISHRQELRGLLSRFAAIE